MEWVQSHLKFSEIFSKPTEDELDQKVGDYILQHGAMQRVVKYTFPDIKDRLA